MHAVRAGCGGQLDEVAAEHIRGEAAVEVTWRAELKILGLERVIPDGSAVYATRITLVLDGRRVVS